MAEPTGYSRASYAGVDPTLAPTGIARAQTDGVLGRRFFAYLIDILVVFGLITLLAIAIFLLGIVTLASAGASTPSCCRRWWPSSTTRSLSAAGPRAPSACA